MYGMNLPTLIWILLHLLIFQVGEWLEETAPNMLSTYSTQSESDINKAKTLKVTVKRDSCVHFSY